MKLAIPITVLISTLFSYQSIGQSKNNSVTKTQQTKAMDDFQYSYKSAHPKAQKLMTDEFYWSPVEETAPYGSDDGFDAAYGFRQWRLLNTTASPISYLKDLIESWHYPYFDYKEMDTVKINKYITQKGNLDEATIKEQIQILKGINTNSPGQSIKLDDNQLREVVIASSNSMGGRYLLGQDNAIIGIAFSQFVLEGNIDSDIKTIAITAIKRQLLPLLINRYDETYRVIRKQQLTKMLEVVNNVK